MNVVSVRIPALRERPEKINELMLSFAQEAGMRLHGQSIRVESEAIAAALDYGWPGNVRELRNRIERAVTLSEGDSIGTRDIFPDGDAPTARTRAQDTAESATLADVRDAAERAHIEAALKASGFVMQEAAARLGVFRTTL